MAEQTAQMALTASLYGQGIRHVLVHSVQELAAQCMEVDEVFAEAVDLGNTLDRYYVPTRYADALASPAMPFKSSTEADAQQARGYAADILNLAKTSSQR